MHGSMSSRPDRLHNQSLSQQQSNSVANLPTELGQQSTRDAPVEDGNQTDSDNGEVAIHLLRVTKLLSFFKIKKQLKKLKSTYSSIEKTGILNLPSKAFSLTKLTDLYENGILKSNKDALF